MKALKQFSYMVMAVAFVMTVSACGSKDNGPKKVAPVPTPSNGYVLPSCTGCPGNMTFLDAAMGIVLNGGVPGMELSLGFFGDPAILGGTYGSGGVFSGTTYNGPVAATGRMIVNMPYNLCGVPAGNYTLQTAVPGMWFYKYSFSGIELIAKGPITVRLWLQGFVNGAIPPAISVDGRQFPYTISASGIMAGQSMYPCNITVFY